MLNSVEFRNIVRGTLPLKDDDPNRWAKLSDLLRLNPACDLLKTGSK